jgi:hypothetical protein
MKILVSCSMNRLGHNSLFSTHVLLLLPTTRYSSHRYLVIAPILLHLFRNTYSDKRFLFSCFTFLHLSATKYSVTEIPPLFWNFLTGTTSCSVMGFLAPDPKLLHISPGADILVTGFIFLFSWCYTTPGPDMLVTGFSFPFSWCFTTTRGPNMLVTASIHVIP